MTSLTLITIACIALAVLHRASRPRRKAGVKRPVVAYGQPFARRAPDPARRRDYRAPHGQRKPVMRSLRLG